MKLSKPLVKRLWAKIIQNKIRNQALCLNLCCKQGAIFLENLASSISSGDKKNIEGQASALYFRYLFGKSFYRDDSIFVNFALNYGYSIFRGSITRTLVAHGLLPCLGLFHSSEQNAFNLADDVIEPFRQIIDLYVAKNLVLPANTTLALMPKDKINLISLLHSDVIMPRGSMSVLSSIEQTVESLVRCYEKNDADLLELPTLANLLVNHQIKL